MNIRRVNQDLLILQRERNRLRFGQYPGWERVDWKQTPSDGLMIYLRRVAMPPTVSVKRTDLRIESGPNVYDPAGKGQFVFYRNLWISPDLNLYDRRRRTWVPMPRLFAPDASGWAFLCIHPHPVSAEKNVLDFIRAFDLFLLNPGLKADGTELA